MTLNDVDREESTDFATLGLDLDIQQLLQEIERERQQLLAEHRKLVKEHEELVYENKRLKVACSKNSVLNAVKIKKS